MFEKEAEEWIKNNLHSTEEDYIKAFKDGAEFGYNKAKEDADKMKSQFLELCNLKDMRIAELEKANEWHYMKDVKYNDPQFLEGRQPCTVKYHKKIMSN